MRWRLVAGIAASVRMMAQTPPPIQVGKPLPPLLDLRDADAARLVPRDTRDPAQAESARRAWEPLVVSFRGLPDLRLRLPAGEARLPMLLAASQALKAQSPQQRLWIVFEPGETPWVAESAWGAVDGGALDPSLLGSSPEQWRTRLAAAQEFFPGRPWTLWLPAEPGPWAGTLLGDGGRLVVPAGGPTASLAERLPAAEDAAIEGGQGDLTLRPASGRAQRWRYSDGQWRSAEPPSGGTEVEVAAARAYDVGALLARMRASQLRDRGAVGTFEADLAVDLHVQGSRGPGVDLGFRFDYFERAGEPGEFLQREVLLNGVKAKLPAGVQLPIMESRTSLAPPVALGLTERYRYSDGGAAGPGQRWIRFDPVDEDPTLFQGRLRVDEASGRIQEERSGRQGLPGTVKSEDRVLLYGPTEGGWRPMSIRTFEHWVSPAGVSQVQRSLVFSSARVDAQGFEARRDAARQGQGVMLKQTVDGLRYYVPDPQLTRRVEKRPRTGGRALGLGLLLDPGLTPPVLPFAGLAFFDFDAFGKGVQFNAFTAGVFNSLAVAVPKLRGGLDLNVNAMALLLPRDERPVRDGRVADREGVGHRVGLVSVAAGRELGAGFRAEAQGRFEYDRYSLARDKDLRTEGFQLPPDGWTREFRGQLAWLWRGFQVRGFYGSGHRPAGTFGAPGALEAITDEGSFRRYGGLASLDREFRPRLWFHGEVGQYAGRGFDRFNAFDVGGLGGDGAVAGIRSNALAADRIAFAKAGLTLPSGPQLRVSFSLDHARARNLGDGRLYAFTGLGMTGDLPGFGWFTALRLNLGAGLTSDVPGVRTVSGLVTLLRVF